MNDFKTQITYRGKQYSLVFNLNVMQAIQDEYKTLQKWGELTDGSNGNEVNAKAIIFGFREMLNEGIDIENEENGTDTKPFSLKQTGRLITEVGMTAAVSKLNETVIQSTQDEKKETAPL